MAKASDPRELMAKKLLEQGSASLQEILTASFGHWPPRGLAIDPLFSHRQKIVFKPVTASVDDLRQKRSAPSRFFKKLVERVSIAGRATLVKDRIIYINKLICRTLPGGLGLPLHLTMGHEAIHILQGDHYWRARSLFGQEGEKAIRKSHNNAASNMIMQNLKSSEDALNKGRLQTAFNRAACMFTRTASLSYLSKGIEMQARLHEMIIDGYPRWGRMPQNPEELWAAMANAGLHPPAIVIQCLNTLPEDSTARHFLSCKKGHTSAAKDMQAVIRSLSEAGKNTFWYTTLPALYADLIEMYGDQPGRERFGFGINPKPALLRKLAQNQASPSKN